jgi:hypothetical protein
MIAINESVILNPICIFCTAFVARSGGLKGAGWLSPEQSAVGFLTFFVDLPAEVLCDGFLDLIIVHKFGKELSVLIHAVNEHIGESVVELKRKVLSAIHLSRPPKVVVFESVFLQLVKEELVSLGEVRP